MHFREKIYHEDSFPQNLLEEWKTRGYRLVFTNGCFDLLHRGHMHYLQEAAELGDKLIVGLNSDSSVRRLKGQGRPVMDQLNRSEILASLMMVDLVIVFDADTPLSLIRKVEPDVLVKGGDWPVEEIVGAGFVMEKGGTVRTLSFIGGESTSAVIERIKKSK
jgi:rfaE bifunctional protein nucleotidyltransferase chain/domain